MHLDNDKLRQSLFLAVLVLLGGLLFWWLKIFLSAFLGAVVFYILLRRPLHILTQEVRYKWPRNLAIAVLMLASFTVIVMPFAMVVVMLSGKVSYLLSHYEEMLLKMEEWGRILESYTGFNLISTDTITRLTTWAGSIIPDILSGTAGAIADVFVLYLILYFMLNHSVDFEKTAYQYLPFKEANNRLLLSELKNQTMSNAIGIPALAVMQAFTAWIGYLIFGVKDAFFWGIITGVMSVLPVVGTAIVWIPLAAYLYLSGFHWQGLALALYGGAIITNIDNVFRFILQRQIGNIHPLVTFFGVIIGLSLFGFVGIIFGPLLISYFILLLKIYRNEYLGEAT